MREMKMEPELDSDDEEDSKASLGLRRAATVMADHVHYAVSDLKPQEWVRNFHVMSICIGINSAVEDLFFSYTNLTYPDSLDFNCDALLCASWALSSLLIASPVTVKLGSQMGIVLGLALHCVQYLAFVVCSVLSDAWYMPTIAYVGTTVGGVGAAVLWTAEGAYFAQSTRRVADALGLSLESKSAALASVFGFWSLGFEFVIKVLSFASREAGFGITPHFGLGVVLAVASTAAAANCTRPVHDERCSQQLGECEGVLGTMSLLPGPRIWLLSFMTLGWAMIEALISGAVSKDCVKPQLGASSVYVLSAVISLVGAAVQYPLRVSAWSCGKGFVMGVGSLLMIIVPVLTKLLDIEHLGWWLVTFYILCGVLRGIYLATNKAIFADHFPEPETEPAFANMSLQSALAQSAAFLFAKRISHDAIKTLIVVLAALVLPGYTLAQAAKRGGPDSNGDSSESDGSSSD